MTDTLHFSREVADALQSERPVVALESTLITHGLPWPENVSTALAMDAAVREAGAVPAIIAILAGQMTVGVERDELDRLARTSNVRKCSRRDLAIAVARGETASTTVSGTLIIAHRAGLKIFATGGIGGVHRGAPFDVSADLPELGRMPFGVVCSGAKAILDLRLTLERLETYGVPIVGFGTDTCPGFYSCSSGLGVDARVDSPLEAARLIETSRRIDARHAVIIAVPVPKEDEIPAGIIESAIEEAIVDAEARQIQGKLLTPFLLKRVDELTSGAASRANRALLVNNARVAALIARELGSLK